MYLSIGQEGVHSFQEAGVQHVGLVQDEHYLLVTTTRTTQHSTEVIIKISCSVLTMNLNREEISRSLEIKKIKISRSHYREENQKVIRK